MGEVNQGADQAADDLVEVEAAPADVLPDNQDGAAVVENQAVDFGLEVVAEHDLDAKGEDGLVESAELEEFDESVMFWSGEEESEDEDEVCSSAQKRQIGRAHV